MPAIVPRNIDKLANADDPRAAIQDAVGRAINEIHPFGAQVLVATYIAPDRIGSIILTDKAKEESLWMGSVGLVLKKGPWAFADDTEAGIRWRGQDVQLGDWVLFRYSSAWEQHFNGVSVRFVEDRDIRAVVDNPRLMSNIPLA